MAGGAGECKKASFPEHLNPLTSRNVFESFLYRVQPRLKMLICSHPFQYFQLVYEVASIERAA
jgi:hypothetical protein